MKVNVIERRGVIVRERREGGRSVNQMKVAMSGGQWKGRRRGEARGGGANGKGLHLDGDSLNVTLSHGELYDLQSRQP